LRSLGGWAALVLFLLPAWAVNSASMQSRMVWTGTVLFFAFLGIMTAMIQAAGPPQARTDPDPTSPLLIQRRLELRWICWLSFLLAELSAIAFTYAQPAVGFFGSYGVLVSSLGANLFPVVAKYATALQPPLSPTALFRVQSIVSIFMLAALPCVVAGARAALVMSDADWRRHFASSKQKRPSNLLVIGMVPFAILVMLMGFFGWLGFDEPTNFDRTSEKGCMYQAFCYARGDDLLIFAAGGITIVAVFGFPLGAILAVIANGVLVEVDES
jgi:hypothetical protein